MAMLTLADVLEYQPDITEYGIQEFDDDFARTEADIYRLLRIKWWTVRNTSSTDITIRTSFAEMDTTRLDEAQFTRAAVFHVLAYYICPRLSKFDPDQDRFQNLMEHYTKRFEEEFELILRDGVKYDDDNDGQYSQAEKEPVHFGRLIR